MPCTRTSTCWGLGSQAPLQARQKKAWWWWYTERSAGLGLVTVNTVNTARSHTVNATNWTRVNREFVTTLTEPSVDRWIWPDRISVCRSAEKWQEWKLHLNWSFSKVNERPTTIIPRQLFFFLFHQVSQTDSSCLLELGGGVSLVRACVVARFFLPVEGQGIAAIAPVQDTRHSDVIFTDEQKRTLGSNWCWKNPGRTMKFSYRRRGRTAEEEVCPPKNPLPLIHKYSASVAVCGQTCPRNCTVNSSHPAAQDKRVVLVKETGSLRRSMKSWLPLSA